MTIAAMQDPTPHTPTTQKNNPWSYSSPHSWWGTQPFHHPVGRNDPPPGHNEARVATINSRKPQEHRRFQTESSPGGNGNLSAKERKFQRLAITSKWQDWQCLQCNTQNSGGFYKCCAYSHHAEPHQLPPNSWQCQQCVYGRSIWVEDNYCTSCTKPNPDVPEGFLKRKPKGLTGFGRPSMWKPVLPVIMPSTHPSS